MILSQRLCLGTIASVCLWKSSYGFRGTTIPTGTTSLSRSSVHVLRAQEEDSKESEKQKLGLLTFDLDDTLYPIAPVVAEANEAFVKAMAGYGFEGLERDQIIQTAKEIRAEIGAEDPEAAAALTHKDVRQLAIRREMEKVIQERKIQACADDWDTSVEDLAPVVVNSAKKWAKNAVSESMVSAVYTTWEMERHHASERHLYPEVLEVLAQIKEDHPDAIIGAVTDGLANPLFMTFTLAPYFDFSCSWEDDQGQRKQFFLELDKTGSDGNTNELTWIYNDARFMYSQLKNAKEGMSPSGQASEPLQFPATYDDKVWIHVGDDLALDVGGSAACGAKTILAELDEERYGQTARFRFDKSRPQPSWSTTSPKEMDMRQKMREASKDKVDTHLAFMSRLPEAINEILAKQ